MAATKSVALRRALTVDEDEEGGEQQQEAELHVASVTFRCESHGGSNSCV